MEKRKKPPRKAKVDIVYGVNSWFIVVILIVISAGIHLFSFRPGHNWGPDFVNYIVQSISLIDGFDLLEMYGQGSGYQGFPWGFPLLLSPVYAIWGLNITAFKIAVFCCFLISIPIINVIFKDKLSAPLRLLIIGFFVFNPWYYEFKNNVLSDIPFFLFSLISLFLIQKYVINKEYWSNKLFSYFILGIIISYSIAIRTQGLVLLPTLLACQVIEWFSHKEKSFIRKPELMTNILPYLIVMFVFIVIERLLPTGNSVYLHYLSEGFSFRNILENIQYYVTLPSEFFGLLPISKVVFGITIPFAVMGGVNRLKIDFLYLIYSVLTLLIYIIWPFQQGLRFIISLMPFFFYFLFVGLNLFDVNTILPERIKASEWKITKTAGIILLLFLGMYTLRYHLSHHLEVMEGPYKADAVEMFNYIIEETEQDDIILFNRPTVMTLYTNRISKGERGNLERIIESQADYFVFNKVFSKKSLMYFLEESDSYFGLIFENDGFLIYEIYPSG